MTGRSGRINALLWAVNPADSHLFSSDAFWRSERVLHYMMCLCTFALPAHCTSLRLKLCTKSNRKSFLRFVWQTDFCLLNIVQKKLHTPKNSWNNLSTDIPTLCQLQQQILFVLSLFTHLFWSFYTFRFISWHNKTDTTTFPPLHACMHSKPVLTSLSVTRVLCFLAYFCT